MVRPVMLYGSETWAPKKDEMNKLDSTEMRMLRWSAGISLKDKIRNEVTRNRFKVRKISEKVQENRRRWFGHVYTREEDYAGKLAQGIKVPDMRENKRGRPFKTWKECVRNDLEELGLKAEDATDRDFWKLNTRMADPK